MDNLTKNKIRKKLLIWYAQNVRHLPWREVHDPYLIWISEVMLQQTQVATVIRYFKRWREQFPSITALADASEEDVLKVWEGLGYYGRARNIKKTADIIADGYNYEFPQDTDKLKKLPGIGDYIAGAIASIAFGFDVPALEANGIRVISRLYDFHGIVNISKNKKILRSYLGELLSPSNAEDFNQAVMDLGSAICLTDNPRCGICPIQKECRAFTNNTQSEIPRKKVKPTKPHFDVVAAILEKDKRVLIAKRPSSGLLGGLWEFPGGKIEPGESHQAALVRELTEELGIKVRMLDGFGVYKHAYTHFSVTVYPYYVEISKGVPKALEAEMIKWADISALQEYPMGKVDRRISDSLKEREYR